MRKVNEEIIDELAKEDRLLAILLSKLAEAANEKRVAKVTWKKLGKMVGEAPEGLFQPLYQLGELGLIEEVKRDSRGNEYLIAEKMFYEQ